MSEKPQSPNKPAKQAEDRTTVEKAPSLPTLFDAFFLDMDRGFAEELARTRTRTQELRVNLEKEVGKARADLARCRENLQDICAGIDKKTSKAEDQAQQLVSTIESQMALLFRRVRPGVDRELRPFSPRKEPVVAPLRRIHESYLKAAQKLPDSPDNSEELDKTTTDIDSQPIQTKDRLALLSRQVRRTAEKTLSMTPRRMAEEFLNTRPAPEQSRLVQAYRKAYEESQTRLSDTWRGLRFHLEIALDDLRTIQDTDLAAASEAKALKTGLQDACTQTTEVFADTDAKLATCLQPLTSFLDGLEERLRLKHRDLSNELRDALEEVDTWGKITGHTLRWTFGRAKRLFHESRERIAHSREEVVRTAGSGITQTGTLLKSLQMLLGRTEAPSEILLNLADLPTQDRVFEHAEDLPSLYQRLFTLGPLKNREFMVAREEELETLEEGLKRWEQGKASSIALVGPEGSGKTSLINCFESEFGNRGEVLRTEFQKRLCCETDLLQHFCDLLAGAENLHDLESLKAHLLAGPRRLIIVEGGHFLALRDIDGLQPARAFVQLMMATHRHCLWLVSFRKYPWQRFDYQLGIARYFTQQVHTLFHDQEELREAIMLRHRTTGLPLTFLGNEDDSSAEALKNNEQNYFRNLFEITSGNLDAAIYYWRISLVAKDNSLTIAPLGRPDLSFLQNLGLDYLFALGEIVGNGGISVEEYCRIFRCHRDCGRMTLEYLAHLNLVKLERTKEASLAYYCLNPVFFGPVTRVLESMNILY